MEVREVMSSGSNVQLLAGDWVCGHNTKGPGFVGPDVRQVSRHKTECVPAANIPRNFLANAYKVILIFGYECLAAGHLCQRSQKAGVLIFVICVENSDGVDCCQ